MNIDGLDVFDEKIIKELQENARATFSEIGERIGLSRVAAKNRIALLEKNGIIQGYKAIIDETKALQGVKFIIDVEAVPENYQEVVDVLGKDKFLRQIYSTTGECRLHAIGFAPNTTLLESHVNYLFRRTKGIRKMSWHLLLTTIKDADGGVEYVQYQESEHLETE